jgi:hypothetical protein
MSARLPPQANGVKPKARESFTIVVDSPVAPAARPAVAEIETITPAQRTSAALILSGGGADTIYGAGSGPP